MILRLAFGTWRDHEFPTLIAATDEYTIDAWSGAIPDFYTEAIDAHRAEYGEVRELLVRVGDHHVLDLFKVPEVAGVVEDAP